MMETQAQHGAQFDMMSAAAPALYDRSAESVMYPQLAALNQGMLVFSSLDSLPSVCEPTPIDTQSAVFVENVPLAQAPWHDDERFLDSLRTLVREDIFAATTNSAPLVQQIPPSCYTRSELFEKLKRSHQETTRTEDLTGYVKFTAPFQHSSNKRRRLSSSENSSQQVASYGDDGNGSCSSSADDGGDSSIRNVHVLQWNQRYAELVEFQKEFKHCHVPLNWDRNPSLSHWVKRQRYQFRIKQEGKHSTMTAERQAALETLGFVWDSHAAGWEERLNELHEFKQRYGHTNVPKKYPDNPQLAVWVKGQRRQFKLYSDGKSSNMSTERIQRLAALGFSFNPRIKNKVSYIR